MNNALVQGSFAFINGLTQGRKVKTNMKITTRKTSTLAIALAIPATSFAGASAAFAADDASTKEVTVDVNLGSDAADSDVTLLAGDEEVGTETADEDGKVSFSYDAEGAETLKVEVGGDTITLTDAKCTAVKDVTEGASEDSDDSSNTGDKRTSDGETASGVNDSKIASNSSNFNDGFKPTKDGFKSTDEAHDPNGNLSEQVGSNTNITDGQHKEKMDRIFGSSSATPKPSDEKENDSAEPSAEKTSESTKPSTGNSDGSSTRVAESLKSIEKNVEKNAATNKTVYGDTKDAEKLSGELKKLEKAEGVDKDKIEKVVGDLGKAIDDEKDGKSAIPAELQLDITDIAKTAIGTLAPQYSGIANTVIDAASGLLGGGSGGSIIDSAKSMLGIGGSNSGSDTTGSDIVGGDSGSVESPDVSSPSVEDTSASAPAPVSYTHLRAHET